MGEGVSGVHDLRGEDGEDFGFIVGTDEFSFFWGELLDGEVADAGLLEEGGDVSIEAVFDFDEAWDDAIDFFQLLGGGKAGFIIHLAWGDEAQVEEVSHADHKELIEVTGKDRDKFQTFQERDGVIPGFFQHAAVKAEPAQFTALCVGI